jgi:anaerobic selenocysteine-containing dehydrogenase
VGTQLTDDFLKDHTVGLEDYLGFLRKARWDDIVEATGLTLEQIHSTGERLLASHATIVCWAMGLTQHKHSLPTLRDVVNVLLLQGNIGKPGAGVCPVRGRSNVQGDRTMGIFEKMPEEFHDMLDQQFGFLSLRKHGYDTVAAIRTMRDGKVRVFIGMGGTFVVPHPPRDARRFETPSGKAHFTGNELEFIKVPPGRLVLQTLRSHDQYNTTIHGKDDRYGGIHGGRRVVMVNGADIAELGFSDGDMVHLVSEFQRVGQAVREYLFAIGGNPDRPGLVDTPARVARAAAEIFGGLHEVPLAVLDKTFDLGHGEMVLVKDIPLYSTCEHHLVPFHGVAHIGYIPSADGLVTGLSRLARLVDAG